MQAKEAVQIAKQYVRDVFGDEKISNVGLEEIVFDDRGAKSWLITVGFSRPWDVLGALGDLAPSLTTRSYKVVRIADADKTVLSVKERTLSSEPA